MPIGTKSRKVWFWLLACLWFCLTESRPILAQQQVLGSIIGRVHMARGDTPPQRVLVTLEYRGAAMDSAYTDSQGTFGFHNIGPGPYYLTLNDDHYQPVRVQAVIEPVTVAPMVFVNIALVPKTEAKRDSDLPAKSKGANPDLMDVREYTAKFPKPVRKEFEKGLEADRTGKRDEAIRHYQKAVQIAPDFYYAHNNLGTDYQSKSDFAAARKEFERVIQLNQSDANAYFNLSNVCMFTAQLGDAEQFLEEGMRRQPDSAFGHFLLGSLNIRQGKLPEAERALRQAIQLDPAMAQARLQLVNLMLQQGRRADAATELHDFVSAFPDSSFSPQAKQLLQRLESSSHPSPAAPQ